MAACMVKRRIIPAQLASRTAYMYLEIQHGAGRHQAFLTLEEIEESLKVRPFTRLSTPS